MFKRTFPLLFFLVLGCKTNNHHMTSKALLTQQTSSIAGQVHHAFNLYLEEQTQPSTFRDHINALSLRDETETTARLESPVARDIQKMTAAQFKFNGQSRSGGGLFLGLYSEEANILYESYLNPSQELGLVDSTAILGASTQLDVNKYSFSYTEHINRKGFGETEKITIEYEVQADGKWKVLKHNGKNIEHLFCSPWAPPGELNSTARRFLFYAPDNVVFDFVGDQIKNTAINGKPALFNKETGMVVQDDYIFIKKLEKNLVLWTGADGSLYTYDETVKDSLKSIDGFFYDKKTDLIAREVGNETHYFITSSFSPSIAAEHQRPLLKKINGKYMQITQFGGRYHYSSLCTFDEVSHLFYNPMNGDVLSTHTFSNLKRLPNGTIIDKATNDILIRNPNGQLMKHTWYCENQSCNVRTIDGKDFYLQTKNYETFPLTKRADGGFELQPPREQPPSPKAAPAPLVHEEAPRLQQAAEAELAHQAPRLPQPEVTELAHQAPHREERLLETLDGIDKPIATYGVDEPPVKSQPTTRPPTVEPPRPKAVTPPLLANEPKKPAPLLAEEVHSTQEVHSSKGGLIVAIAVVGIAIGGLAYIASATESATPSSKSKSLHLADLTDPSTPEEKLLKTLDVIEFEWQQ